MSWQLVKLEEVCEINIGKTPSRSNLEYWKDGTDFWLSIADMSVGENIISTKEKITKKAINDSRIKLVNPNTILLSYKLSVGKVGISQYPLYTNEAIAALPIKNPKQLDTRYLLHVLKNVDFHKEADRAAKGLTLNKDKLKKIEIPLPSLTNQRLIAAILDKANEIEANRKLALTKLDKLAQSIFIDMFGDVIKNPKNLPVKQLKDILKLKSGDALTASSMKESGIYQVYGGNGVNGLHDNFMYEDKIIVIGRVGAYCGCVHITSEKCWVTDNALAVKILDSNINFEYLAFALKEANLNQYSSQSGQPLISGSRLYPINIITPSLLMQENFAKIKVAIDAQKEVLSKSSNLFSLFLKSLHNQAFTTGFNA